jgi:hypothetical protein
MRARTVFIILLVLILLVAFGPALVAVGSQEIAEFVLGCQVHLNRVIPCVIGGKDYGQTFYDLASPFGILICRFRPVSCSLCWTVAATIVFLGWLADRRRKTS